MSLPDGVPDTPPLIRHMAAKMLQARRPIRQKSEALVGRGPESDPPL
jgi:hypothetical protein